MLDESRGAYIGKLADARLDAIADATILAFCGLGPDARQSGDDSPLGDVWEEFKEQVQNGESILWDVYEDTMIRFCESEVEKLAPFERDVLWFWTNGFFDWDEEDEAAPPIFTNQVVREVFDRIKSRADIEPLLNELEDEDDEAEGDQLEASDGTTQVQLRLDW